MNYKTSRTSLLLILAVCLFQSCQQREKRILVFSKTAGFRHESIKDGKIALLKLGLDKGIKVDTSENAAYFTEDSLKNYSAIIFLNTTGDILNYRQQVAFERYIQAGGGFMGIHSATDTEYHWPWFVKMIGGNFDSHPQPQKASIRIVDKNHPATKVLPSEWVRTDEWYNFKNLNSSVKVLAVLDEKSYSGGKNGANHPLIWYHDYDGGRVYYTGCGHTKESYTEKLFLDHLAGGIEYAIGDNKLDYKKAMTQALPEDNRFNKEIIVDDLDEPLMMDIAADGRVFFIERKGNLFCYFPKNGFTKKLYNIPVNDYAGNGLMGLALDPDFIFNNNIYLFYINKALKYNLSRFVISGNTFNANTEKIILSFPIDKEPSAHNGGSIAFDSEKNILISVGDNTPPWQANGYAPMDQAPGRAVYDAQRTAANANDLRGKILRIKINKDATYSIPEGNLFNKDGSEGRPEIYVMGCRNPWRMIIDPRTNYTYWGEVGPDAGIDSTIGPMGYDELNQARKAGNFGWPYFIANNKPYKKINHQTGEVIENVNIKHIVNTSPNNTSNRNLPAPQIPIVWYPYSASNEFPEVGKGGRTICAGPFYYYNDYKNSNIKFPAYYNGKLLFYEWMRDWIMAVTLDSKGNYVKMEPVLPNLKFEHLTHMKFGPDGALYVLEYGMVWYAQNKNARLSRIVYNIDNRPPVIHAILSDSIGMQPLTVKFDAHNTKDPDKDNVVFEWDMMGEKLKGGRVDYIFNSPGIYEPVLYAKDSKGAVSMKKFKVIVGNTYPKVEIKLNTQNRSFYWNNEKNFYNVSVADREDKYIDKEDIKVILDYVPEGDDIYPIPSISHVENKIEEEQNITDNPLIAKSDCKACHTISRKSIGPAFTAIAEKYKWQKDIKKNLTKKIINGGSGVWGAHAMSAHPQISQSEAREMVDYIFSTIGTKGRVTKALGTDGSFETKTSLNRASYYITASYTDKGFDKKNGLTTTDIIKLRNPLIKSIEKDSASGTIINSSTHSKGNYRYIGFVKRPAYMLFKKVDLTNIGSITMQINSNMASGKVEIRIDSLKGRLISTFPVHPTGKWEDWYTEKSKLENVSGIHTIYVNYVNSNNSTQPDLIMDEMININSIFFERFK